MFAKLLSDTLTALKGALLLLLQTLKKSFSFAGRATRREFWLFVVADLLLTFLLLVITNLMGKIHVTLAEIFLYLTLAVFVLLLIPFVSVAVRRLHDVGLSGFWFWYLNPVGLPVIFVVYLLELDKAAERIVDKIQNIGSPWLGWILTWLFWPCGATAALVLLFLYAGKKEDNEFGPNPCLA